MNSPPWETKQPIKTHLHLNDRNLGFRFKFTGHSLCFIFNFMPRLTVHLSLSYSSNKTKKAMQLTKSYQNYMFDWYFSEEFGTAVSVQHNVTCVFVTFPCQRIFSRYLSRHYTTSDVKLYNYKQINKL